MGGVSSQFFRQLMAWAVLPINPVSNQRAQFTGGCTVIYDGINGWWTFTYDGTPLPLGRFLMYVGPNVGNASYSVIHGVLNLIGVPGPIYQIRMAGVPSGAANGCGFQDVHDVTIAVFLYLIPER